MLLKPNGKKPNVSANSDYNILKPSSVNLVPPRQKAEVIKVRNRPNYLSESPQYLQVDNKLSEYDTKAEQLAVKLNLGIDGNAVWGNVDGYIEDQQDLINYIDNTLNEELIPVTKNLQEEIQKQSEQIESVQKEIYDNLYEKVIYTPDAADDTTINLQNVKAQDLRGKDFSEVLDILLFPEYEAQAGTLPVITISNPNLTLEVGSTIPDASYSITSSGSTYQYIKQGDAYISGTYGYTTPTVSTTKESKAVFGISARSTTATTYTVTGPSADVLAEGIYLYKSKGSKSTIQPKAIGNVTKSLSATSATITGVYKGGKNGTKNSSIYINSSGKLSSTIGGAYNNTLSYDIKTDTASTSDHVFNTLGIPSVELYVPSGVSYTVKLTATKYNAGNGKFEVDSDLTKKLNALITNTSAKTFSDASGTNYNVTSYSINTSNIIDGGKFIVKMSITKN